MIYPKSEDRQIQKITNVLSEFAISNGVTFSFQEEEIYPIEVFSDFGFLTVFLADAKILYEKIFNNLYSVSDLMSVFGNNRELQLSPEQVKIEHAYYAKTIKTKVFPVNFVENESALLDMNPVMKGNLPSDFILVSHFAHYTVEEYIKIYKRNKSLLIDGKIPLEPIVKNFTDLLSNGKILVKPTLKITEKKELESIS
jgi:hypothetical protein